MAGVSGCFHYNFALLLALYFMQWNPVTMHWAESFWLQYYVGDLNNNLEMCLWKIYKAAYLAIGLFALTLQYLN